MPHNTTTTGSAFTFSISTSAPGWGFNIAIYDPSATKLTRSVYTNLSGHINDGVTGVNAGNHGNELQHYSRQTGIAGDETDPTFDFVAPVTLGTYTIYGCLNQVNSNGFDGLGDGPAECDSDTFIVINNPPDAVNDSIAISVSEDDVSYSANVDMLGNDNQTESDAFAWLSHSVGGIVGDLERVSGGTYRYRPNGQFESLSEGQIDDTESFTYTIRETGYTGATDCDGSPCTDTATVTIRVTGVNDRPTAVDDGTAGAGAFVTVQEGMAVDNGTDGDGSNNDLASNDTDPDTNDTRDATRTGCPAGVTDPVNGTITNFGADGTFTYTHDSSNTTADTFTYCTIDNSGTGTSRSLNSATVHIRITPINDAPTIATSAGDTAFTEQTPVIVDGDLTLVDGDSTEFSGATVEITGNAQAGDQLACGALPAGISCSAPGTLLTLSSAPTSTIADYETALEAVTFTSSSDNPDLGARTITFIVEDDLNAFSSAVVSAQKIIDPITRSNDSPSLAAINPPTIDADSNHAYENTGADPYTFSITAVASDVDSDDDVNDGSLISGGSGSLTYSLTGAPAGMTISNDNANPGLITWNPPITGIFGQSYGPITVRVVDGGENGAVAATRNFNLTVSPPDDDGDMVANYDDYCISVADPSNINTDGDGTLGTDGPAADEGGDACDSDDDNDGMPDAWEITNSLNPLVDDAAGDADNDGVSNLDEYLNGTNPNQKNLVIDATGYLTPYKLKPPSPTSIHSLATAVTANDYGPYRPGDNTITWTPSNASDSDLATSDPGNLVSDPPEQPFFIRPLVNLGPNQQAEENAAVMVTVTLNGDSPSWPANPATVTYKVSGTAGAADHDAANGVVTFNDGEYIKTINFNTLPDAKQDPDETVVFTLTQATNAALGSQRTHKVTIVEDNVAPQVELQFSQGGIVVGSTYAGDGAITIDALVSDVNGAQGHSYDWSNTDNALVPPGNVASWSPLAPVAGNYLVDVLVTDTGNPKPSKSTRMTRILRVGSGMAAALGAVDSDLDGTLDNDAAEGYADDDGDGIPNYLDAIDGLVAGGNLLPDQTRDASASRLLQTESGLRLGRGSTAQASNRFGALLTDTEIRRFGSMTGDRPANPQDDQEHVGGIYDFEIRGLVPGASASIVIPLQSAIPKNAEYRKFHPSSGWTVFAEDNNNRLASASAEDGACPEPGSKDFRDGLNYLDNCLELTIQDGGPNDTDNRTNGVVSDPGTVSTRLSEPQEEEVKDGGGRLSPLLLISLLMLGGIAAWRRRREVSAGPR